MYVGCHNQGATALGNISIASTIDKGGNPSMSIVGHNNRKLLFNVFVDTYDMRCQGHKSLEARCVGWQAIITSYQYYRSWVWRSEATTATDFVRVLHNIPLFVIVTVQHTQCPCRYSIQERSKLCLRRSAIEVHPIFSEVPHSSRSTPHPKTIFSKKKNASRRK